MTKGQLGAAVRERRQSPQPDLQRIQTTPDWMPSARATVGIRGHAPLRLGPSLRSSAGAGQPDTRGSRPRRPLGPARPLHRAREPRWKDTSRDRSSSPGTRVVRSVTGCRPRPPVRACPRRPGGARARERGACARRVRRASRSPRRADGRKGKGASALDGSREKRSTSPPARRRSVLPRSSSTRRPLADEPAPAVEVALRASDGRRERRCRPNPRRVDRVCRATQARGPGTCAVASRLGDRRPEGWNRPRKIARYLWNAYESLRKNDRLDRSRSPLPGAGTTPARRRSRRTGPTAS